MAKMMINGKYKITRIAAMTAIVFVKLDLGACPVDDSFVFFVSLFLITLH